MVHGIKKGDIDEKKNNSVTIWGASFNWMYC